MNKENKEKFVFENSLPAWAVESMDQYVENGRPMGHFLEAVFANDLFDAFGRADHTSQYFIQYYVAYIYNYFPGNCHGSYDIVQGWMKTKREAAKENE